MTSDALNISVEICRWFVQFAAIFLTLTAQRGIRCALEEKQLELEPDWNLPPNRYSGYSLLRLEPLVNMNQVDAVLTLREKLEDERTRQILFFDDVIWARRRPVKLIVSAAERRNVEEHLVNHGIKYNVTLEDISDVLDYNDDLNMRQRYRYNRQVDEFHGPLPPNHFMSYDDILKRVTQWAEAFRHLGVDVFSIGKTTENRETIAISISLGDNQADKECTVINDGMEDLPAVWIDGGIDSRVWLSTASVLHVAYKLIKATDDATVVLRQSYRWYIVPTVNPDGYHFSMTEDRFWRKTRKPYDGGCFGVDINHNFNISWSGSGTTSNPCMDRHSGPEPFSDPESANLRSALERCSRTRGGLLAYVSFQGHGHYIWSPWTGRNMLKPDNYDYLWVVAKEAMSAADSKGSVGAADEKFRFGTPPDIRYPIRGSVLDWVRQQLDVKWSFAVDVAPSDDSLRHPLGFSIPATAVYQAAQQAVAIVLTTVRAIQAGPTVDLLELYAGQQQQQQQHQNKGTLKDEL